MDRRLLVLALLVTACDLGRPRRDLPFLEDQYSPATAPASLLDSPLPREPEIDGDVRHQLVTGPNGKLYRLRWENASDSVGRPAAGSLSRGRAIPSEGAGFQHIGKRPYGTDETVVYVMFAAWTVQALFPGTVPVVIGDLSDDGGGHVSPHRSHQTGRDADIGLYKSGNRRLRVFEALGPEELDAEKTWIYIEALLRTQQVLYIFMDRRLQEALHAHARGEGWSDDVLAGIFQFPGGNVHAVIRHEPGHKNHMHVRFRCPRDDTDCVP